MSDVFFRDLEMPKPDVDLGVGSLSHAHQTAEIMKRFEEILVRERPDCVIVVGDVNSTVACSLVASKIEYPEGSRRSRPSIVHVEAGLRSFDRSMPEEINRIVTDALSDLLFITEQSGLKNLAKEGISRDKIHWVGNTMVDTLLRHREKAQRSEILYALGLTDSLPSLEKRLSAKKSPTSTRRYAVATLHRPSNVDNFESFREILEALVVVAQKIPVVFPVHPRTKSRIHEFQLGHFLRFDTKPIPETGITCIAPLGYLDFLCLMSNAKLMLTDSGGIQEETTVLGVPCVTLRKNTERPVTITSGTNILAGTKKDEIIRRALERIRVPKQPSKPKHWDGKAGRRIIQVLVRHLAQPKIVTSKGRH
jgi:UDP-N-acetylglucosamine 2-epimerase (non-hydrolysing)